MYFSHVDGLELTNCMSHFIIGSKIKVKVCEAAVMVEAIGIWSGHGHIAQGIFMHGDNSSKKIHPRKLVHDYSYKETSTNEIILVQDSPNKYLRNHGYGSKLNS